MKVRFPFLILVMVWVAAGWAAASVEKPNFIVVFVDNLGYGDIEPFGSTLHRTPALNRMADEGRKFTHFYASAGVCTPSRASLMTGCYAQRVSMHYNERDQHVLRPVSPYGLNPDEVTVAEVLKTQGYSTAMIGKWHLGDQLPFLPTRQGFDEYFGVPYSDDMTERDWPRDGSRWPPLPLMEGERVIEAPVDRDYLTQRETMRALDWIERNQQNPFFLYLPQAMPGSTNAPFSSPDFKGKSRNGAWGDAVEELDWSLGQILDKLRELKLAEKTCVIWTSDNGAPINQDPADLSRGSNLPMAGRGYTTAEGGFRVPMIAWWPGSIPAGTVCEEMALTLDILPTLASLAGGKPPQDRVVDGKDITGLLMGAADAGTPHEAFFFYYLDQIQAVRSGDWKLYVPLEDWVRHPHYGNKKAAQGPLLFDVRSDPGETMDLAAANPDVVRRLNLMVDEMRKDLGDKDRPGPGMRPRGRVEQPEPRLLQP
jgi:arylsulfatase A-like enzyme